MTWEKFQRGTMSTMSVEEVMRIANCTRAQAEEFINKDRRQLDAVWLNNLYQVNVYRVEATSVEAPPLKWLSIKRRDKAPVHDWRDFQRIKNEIVGPECEGVELYPAESRLVDCANQYHMFVITDPNFRFPFGFNERAVKIEAHDGQYKQRGAS